MIYVSDVLKEYMNSFYEAADDHDRARCGAYIIGYLEAMQEVAEFMCDTRNLAAKVGADEYSEHIDTLLKDFVVRKEPYNG